MGVIIIDFGNLFSECFRKEAVNNLRESLRSSLEKEEILSFAGGHPHPEVFPANEITEIGIRLLKEDIETAIAYNVGPGYKPLRQELKERFGKMDIMKEQDDIVIVNGVLQGLDFSARILIDEGNSVVCDYATYTNALNIFKSYKANIIPVPSDENGMCLEHLEMILKERSDVKIVYTIPTFHNPLGTTMCLERRKKLLEMAERYNYFIIEDNVFGELRFKGEYVPTIKSMDTNGRVIYLGSYSKVCFPGLRVGWVVAHSKVCEKVIYTKQLNDLHTNIFAQMLLYYYLKEFDIHEKIGRIVSIYKRRCDLMMETIQNEFPGWCEYSKPDGGLFIWCTMPEKYDAAKILKRSLTYKNISFAKGDAFLVEDKKTCQSFRLNFSATTEKKIEVGIKELGSILKGV